MDICTAVQQMGADSAVPCSLLDESPAVVRGRLAANMIVISNCGWQAAAGSVFVCESSDASRLENVGD